MKKRITGALILAMSSAQANIDRAGNVIDSDSSEFGGGAFLAATVVSLAVLHFYGDGAMLKLWGAGLLVACVIGLLRRFVS